MWLANVNKLSFIESAFQGFLSGQRATRATVGVLTPLAEITRAIGR